MKAHPKPILPEIGRVSLFRGMYSRIARQLGVSPQIVRQVANGISSSKRVALALKREIKRISASRGARGPSKRIKQLRKKAA